jgi:hypothetical protein
MQCRDTRSARYSRSPGSARPSCPTPHYANIVVVAMSGGDFTDLQSAINSITDASPTNKYLIKIMPGTFVNNNLTALRADVDIEGSGKTATKLVISKSFTGDNLINVAIKDLTIEATLTSSGLSYDKMVFNCNFGALYIENVNIYITAHGSVEAIQSGGVDSSLNISNSLIKFIPPNDGSYQYYEGIRASGNLTLSNVVMDINAGTIGAGTAIFANNGNGGLNVDNSDIYASSVGIDTGGLTGYIGKIINSKIVGNGQNSGYGAYAICNANNAPNNIAIINSQLGPGTVFPITSVTKLINNYDLNYNIVPNN